MIRVDYRCSACAVRAEHVVASPPPADVGCPSCSAPARRVFSALAVVGRASAPAPARTRVAAPSCASNPGIPGLCHIAPEAATAYVARARGDNRTLERELERQEQVARERPDAVLSPVGGHSHAHSHPHVPGADAPVRAPVPGGTS